jgi:hypothetical protein
MSKKTVLVSLFILTLFLFPGTTGRANPGPPPSFYLGEILFVDDAKFDHDGDGLRDDLEYKLAEAFKPLLVFDSHEKNRRTDEPRTLFQVRPGGLKADEGCVGFLEAGISLDKRCISIVAGLSTQVYGSGFKDDDGCIGKGCEAPWSVRIRYLFLFQRDGGYGPASDCVNAHNGDNEQADVQLESDDGQNWRPISAHILDWESPASAVQWVKQKERERENHPVIYMSAHKHHTYLDTSYDGEDSLYSEWGCNENVNGAGARIWPDLISPLTDKRPNNAGEPELHSYKWVRLLPGEKPESGYFTDITFPDLFSTIHILRRDAPEAKYFIDALDAYGYPGEKAWSNKKFAGGLKYEGVTDSNVVKWLKLPFKFGSEFFVYRPLALLKGRIANAKGKAIPGAKLYFRSANFLELALGGGRGPWGTLPVDADGYYSVKVKESGYMIRPAASGYNFKAVPKTVYVKSGECVESNFIGTSNSSLPDLADLKDISLENKGKPLSSSDYDAAMDVVSAHALRLAAPHQMVGPDAKALDGGKEDEDPLVELPRRFTLSFHLESVLDRSGKPAKSPGEVAYSTVIATDFYGTPHKTTGPPQLGGPVAGAKIQARLVTGPGLVMPEKTEPVEVVTNPKGDAFVTLRSGVHPGYTQVEVAVVSNPANPWAVFSIRTPVELQPAVHGDDTFTEPKVALITSPTEYERLVPVYWWKTVLPGTISSVASSSDSRAVSGDVNFDRVVDQRDAELLGEAQGKKAGQKDFNAAADLNNDGVIDQQDEIVLRQNMGRRFSPPELPPEVAVLLRSEQQNTAPPPRQEPDKPRKKEVVPDVLQDVFQKPDQSSQQKDQRRRKRSRVKDILQEVLQKPGQGPQPDPSRPQPRKVQSTMEAEELVATARPTAGQLMVQDMRNFGEEWSGGTQLGWVGAQLGDRLVLIMNVPAAGRYAIAGYFTQAPDEGIFRFFVNEQQMGGAFNGYADTVMHSGKVVLGTAYLRAGENTFWLEIMGKDERSNGYLVGIDRFELGSAPDQ